MTIQQTLNVNNNQNLYLQGHITASTVTLAGNAQLFLTENVNISNIISNNGPTNTLYTSSYFNYDGITYLPGDTIFTGGGTWNYVPVKLCESTPVSIRVKYFRLIPNGLEWEAYNGVPVLQYSVDSRNWENVTTTSPYLNPSAGFYRLALDGTYSEIIKLVKPSVRKLIKIVDFMGNETTDFTKPFIEIYNDGTTRKVMRL